MGQNVDGSAVLAGSRGIQQPQRTNDDPVQVIATGQVVLGLSYVVVGGSDERPDDPPVEERLGWIAHRPDRCEGDEAADGVFAHGCNDVGKALGVDGRRLAGLRETGTASQRTDDNLPSSYCLLHRKTDQ